jgi:hypothetical protein
MNCGWLTASFATVSLSLCGGLVGGAIPRCVAVVDQYRFPEAVAERFRNEHREVQRTHDPRRDKPAFRPDSPA